MKNPDLYSNFLMGLWLPAFQALFTGVLGALLTLAGGFIGRAVNPWLWALAVGALVAFVTWLLCFGHWRRIVYQVDPIQDVTQVLPSPIRVELEHDPNHLEYIDLPAPGEKVITLAVGLVAGATFNESSWTGSGAPFSRAQFRRLRDELLRRQLLQWVNPSSRAQGLELTPPGKAVMRHFASMSPTLPSGLTPIRRDD